MSKIYVLNIDYYYKSAKKRDYEYEVYSSLDRAVEEGKYFLAKRLKENDFKDYVFSVEEIDIEYAENFDVEKLGIKEYTIKSFRNIKPTHIIHFYDKDGKLLYDYIEYRNKQRESLFGFRSLSDGEIEKIMND